LVLVVLAVIVRLLRGRKFAGADIAF